MRILVAISSYGASQDQYLTRLIEVYRSMSLDLDIVVMSNVEKEVGPGIEVIVGLPDPKDGWSLVYAHKTLFAERLDKYDLFIHTENDILITEGHIESFLKLSAALQHDEIPGFLRYEVGPAKEINFPDIHASFHWDGRSVVTRGPYTFAYFTNEQAACYLLTQDQLRRAIQSGGYLVPPHLGQYGVCESAATDPYTQCGFKKLVCISQVDDSLVHHLSNKYVKKLGIERPEFQTLIDTLMDSGKKSSATSSLFPTRTKLKRSRYSKDYYEHVRPDVVSMIPSKARSVLSLGCGWGATEEWLAKKGRRVVAVPLDSVISSCAEARGIETVVGDFKTVREKLEGQRFDCLLISNVLHLVGDPVAVISSFASLLSEDSTVIALVPNQLHLPMLRRRIRDDHGLGDLRKGYQDTGVHFTSPRVLRKWFKRAGLRIERVSNTVPKRFAKLHHLTLGLMDLLLAEDLVVVARCNRAHPSSARSADMARALKGAS
jgi:2-polyprenyl-3-methyl-5-hydroxy-6-metoxy-1,4-benzoquinol methylase